MNPTNDAGVSQRFPRNTLNLAIWTGLWLVTMALAVFGPILVWHSEMLSLGAILVNVAAGIGMIFANVRHLNGLDELQRKIQLEAMAAALGVGVVGGLAYSTLDIANVISGDAEISVLVILISLTYMIGVITGQLRYR